MPFGRGGLLIRQLSRLILELGDPRGGVVDRRRVAHSVQALKNPDHLLLVLGFCRLARCMGTLRLLVLPMLYESGELSAIMLRIPLALLPGPFLPQSA